MIPVHIWSDVACPWCFIGKVRFEEALRLEDVQADVVWHAYELDPRPRTATSFPSYVEWLSNKHGVSLSQATTMTRQMTQRGHELGIVFDFDTAIPANTFDAHRLLHGARLDRGAPFQNALKEVLLRAHFSGARDLNQRDVLAELAVEAGWGGLRATELLTASEFADEVRADEREAQKMRIGGVPFFVIGKYGVAGAQSVETFRKVLREAQSDGAS